MIEKGKKKMLHLGFVQFTSSACWMKHFINIALTRHLCPPSTCLDLCLGMTEKRKRILRHGRWWECNKSNTKISSLDGFSIGSNLSFFVPHLFFIWCKALPLKRFTYYCQRKLFGHGMMIPEYS